VIKFTSCLPMVGGSLRVLRLSPPLKLVAMIYIVAEILLKVALKHQKSNQNQIIKNKRIIVNLLILSLFSKYNIQWCLTHYITVNIINLVFSNFVYMYVLHWRHHIKTIPFIKYVSVLSHEVQVKLWCVAGNLWTIAFSFLFFKIKWLCR
jgi:hypothetical protein